MLLKKLGIQVSENENGYLITTSLDSGIYAEGETIEDALINFLDVFKTVKSVKGNDFNIKLFEKDTKETLFDLPVGV